MGHSATVGRPMALELLNCGAHIYAYLFIPTDIATSSCSHGPADATVTTTHVHTRDLRYVFHMCIPWSCNCALSICFILLPFGVSILRRAHVGRAEVLVVACGVPRLIKGVRCMWYLDTICHSACLVTRFSDG